MFILDTNATSDIIKARSPEARRLLSDALQTNRVAISVLTQAEILFGIRKRPDAVRFREAYDNFVASVEVLPWTETAAVSYAELRSALFERRRTVDTIDLLIASQAHSLSAIVVTRDQDFQYLSDLVQTTNWATDLQKPQ